MRATLAAQEAPRFGHRTLVLSKVQAAERFHWEDVNLHVSDHPGTVAMLGVYVKDEFRAMVLEFSPDGGLERAWEATGGLRQLVQLCLEQDTSVRPPADQLLSALSIQSPRCFPSAPGDALHAVVVRHNNPLLFDPRVISPVGAPRRMLFAPRYTGLSPVALRFAQSNRVPFLLPFVKLPAALVNPDEATDVPAAADGGKEAGVERVSPARSKQEVPATQTYLVTRRENAYPEPDDLEVEHAPAGFSALAGWGPLSDASPAPAGVFRSSQLRTTNSFRCVQRAAACIQPLLD
jgi:hypothetical protein